MLDNFCSLLHKTLQLNPPPPDQHFFKRLVQKEDNKAHSQNAKILIEVIQKAIPALTFKIRNKFYLHNHLRQKVM